MNVSEFTFDETPADKPSVDHDRDIKNCIRLGDITSFTSLLHTDRNIVNADINGWGKPHMYASKAGRLSIVKLLVEHGADVNASENGGQTALYFAIWYDHFDIFEYLVSKGANVNQRDSFNSTPLMQAAYYRRKEMFELLIKRGADSNAEDNRGIRPLEYLRDMCPTFRARSWGLPKQWNPDMVQFGAKSRIDLCSDDTHKLSVIDFLTADNKALNYKECNNLGILDVTGLILRGDIASLSSLVGIPDIDVVNMDIPMYGKPLIYAAMQGNISIVKLLVQNGADVNASDDSGSSALFYAAWHDHYDVAFYLVSRGADVNKCDTDNSTPLIEAAFYKRKEMVELFMKRNDDICAKNNGGMNAIDFAKREGYREIVTLLEKEIRNRGLDNTGKYGDISVDEAQIRGRTEYNPNYLVNFSKRVDTEEKIVSDYEYSGFAGTDGCAFDQGIPGDMKKIWDFYTTDQYSSDSSNDEEMGVHRGPEEKRRHKTLGKCVIDGY